MNDSQTSPQSGLIGLLLRLGIVKTVSQANYLLIGISVVAILISVWFMIPHKFAPTNPPPFNPNQPLTR